jgi:hypothetical protein
VTIELCHSEDKMGHQQWKPPTVRTKGCLLAVAMKAGVDADAVTNHFNGPY